MIEWKEADEPIFELVDVKSVNIVAVVFEMTRIWLVGWGGASDGVANPDFDLAGGIKKRKKTDAEDDNDNK